MLSIVDFLYFFRLVYYAKASNLKLYTGYHKTKICKMLPRTPPSPRKENKNLTFPIILIKNFKQKKTYVNLLFCKNKPSFITRILHGYHKYFNLF